MSALYPKLIDLIDKNDYIKHLEDEIWNEKILIDEGFYVEVYINPDGIYQSSNGYSLFRYVNKEISFGDLLKLELFNQGSLKESTMTISIIPNKDISFKEERKLCTNLFN